MKRRKDPLIFIVEDNPVYNKLIINYLQSKNFNRIESFFSGEECVLGAGVAAGAGATAEVGGDAV